MGLHGDDAEDLYAAMDINKDNRLFVSEVASWMLVAVEHHFEESTIEADEQFRGFGISLITGVLRC